MINITVYHDAAAAVTVASTAHVIDSPIITQGVSNFTVTAGTPFTARIATFTGADTAAYVGEYHITINWGDGTALDTLSGTVSGTGSLDVLGTHTYDPKKKQTFTVQITIADSEGTEATATTRIYDPPATTKKSLTPSMPNVVALDTVYASVDDWNDWPFDVTARPAMRQGASRYAGPAKLR